MKTYQFPISVFVVAGLTILSGLTFGHVQRAANSPQRLARAAHQLEGLPHDIGDWKLQDSQELSSTVITMLKCAGYLNNTYVHQQTGETVHIALVLGPTGPIAVHTPEICYSSQEFRVGKPREEVAIGQHDSFWGLTMQPRSLTGSALRVYYAWSDGSSWVAARQPRFSYATRPYLYKMQLASYVASADSEPASDDEACRRFLESFVPVLKEFLLDPDHS